MTACSRILKRFCHDPDATLDYTWDWSRWLSDGDVIVSHEVFAETGVTVDSTSADDSSVTAWLSNGENRESVLVTCRVVTVDGRIDDRSIMLSITER